MSKDEQTETVVGIDLGTTYSCAAFMESGKAKIIPSEKGYTTVPSVVGLSPKGQIIVGHPALDQMVTNPKDTIFGSKRLVGRPFNSFVVQKMKSFMSYSIVEGSHGEAAVSLGGTTYNLQQISAFILAEIKDMAEGILGKQIRKAVLTVPAHYNDNQRHAVKEAGKLAGLEVERIVNEPTAAAIAYGFNKGFDQKILVYDLGGGTFDVSILHVHGNEFEVLATGGDTFLGGVDFDLRITDWILSRFEEATKKNLREEAVATQRIRSAAERAKRELSLEKEVEINLPYITDIRGNPTDLKLKITREKLNQLTVDLVDKTLEMCDQVLASKGMDPQDINEILLVGGQTRMPLVQGKIQSHFGKQPRKGVHPDEVVALGAAILGNKRFEKEPLKLKDVLAIPIGVALSSGRFKVILDRNMPIPATKSFKLVMGKEGIDIDIYQGDHAVIHENEYLGTFQFAPEKTVRVNAPLEMKFHLSEESLLTVTARDLETGQQTSVEMITLQSPKSMQASVGAVDQESDLAKTGWFRSFARKVMGR